MSKKMETKLISFGEGELLGVKTKDGIFLGVKKACQDIGLTEGQARRQIENIQKDLVLRSKCTKFAMVQNEGKRSVSRDVICIHEDIVTLWLAKIALTPAMRKSNPEVVDKLINYQLKAAKVLHNAFMATEEQKQEFFDEMGLKGEIIDLKGKVVILSDRVDSLINNSTINSRQSQKLLACARDKVRELLGDAHSVRYKKFSRIYFKNLWNNFCDQFSVGSYKDLNPLNYQDGFKFIENWEYVDVK